MMPRRNYPPRTRPARFIVAPNDPAEGDYEAIARRLVRAGKCSRLILDRPPHADQLDPKRTTGTVPRPA